MIFLFITSGLFLGWTLGANDAANVFGSAVGSRMVSFTRAAVIACLFVILGAVLQGQGASDTLGRLGSVNAMGGSFTVALAAGLTEMVANLTIGRKEFQTVEDDMKKIAKTAADLRQKLENDIDNDAQAYQAVLAAFKLPKEKEDEKKLRSDAIQQAFKTAATVPLGVARDAVNIMNLAVRAADQLMNPAPYIQAVLESRP